jgi:hypothetical protein
MTSRATYSKVRSLRECCEGPWLTRAAHARSRYFRARSLQRLELAIMPRYDSQPRYGGTEVPPYGTDGGAHGRRN